MKSLILFTYRQGLNGYGLRLGVVHSKRNTKRCKLSPSTVEGPYRRYDSQFQRTKNLYTIQDYTGYKQYYRERMGIRIEIPFIGSLFTNAIEGKAKVAG